MNGHSTNGDASSPPPSLAGKVALVTGASRGIGAGIALELGARHASVVVNYVKGKAGADEMVEKIEKAGGKAVAIQADVSKVAEITRLFEAAKAHFGKINIVCSNSGTESFDKTEDITEEKYDYVFGLNTRAQFFVGQHAYKYCETGGRCILMSSIAAGLLGVADHALYSGSKSAVNGIVKSFATDFGKKGMTCNAIAPGGVKSDMFTQVAWRYIPGADGSWSAEAIENAMASHCPLGRCAVPQDIARVVAFLASDDGGWVNGTVKPLLALTFSPAYIPQVKSSPSPVALGSKWVYRKGDGNGSHDGEELKTVVLILVLLLLLEYARLCLFALRFRYEDSTHSTGDVARSLQRFSRTVVTNRSLPPIIIRRREDVRWYHFLPKRLNRNRPLRLPKS